MCYALCCFRTLESGRQQLISKVMLTVAANIISASIINITRDYSPRHAEEQRVSYAALSVVSIADFKVQQGAEVAEGVGSGLVWDRWTSAASFRFDAEQSSSMRRCR